MIPVNPKVGDLFVDDGREYEVTAIVDFERFESKATGRFGLSESDEELACQYCGKVCKSALGLSSHERNCPSNPNKGGEK